MLSFKTLHPDFGAQVTGLDLAGPPAGEDLEALREAIDRFSLLCFPDQVLDDGKQLALTKALGEPEIDHLAYGREGRVQYFGTVGNIDAEGRQRGNDHEMTRYATGNQMWHSDSSFREVPTFVSINYAYEVPGEGGETEFVSARAAYVRLSTAEKAALAPLQVVHDYVYSRSKVAPVKPSHADSLPPVRQRLVRSNPRTGARNLFIGSHAREVVGRDEAESRHLLDDLLARATRAEDVYAHCWRPGDLVIWDNRCLLHRGRPYDADRYRRRMRQTRVRGAGSTLDESFA
ncbi:MAG: TauD/TfdA family dioxygenase [Kiloniellales bacterium]|nr:TauD/TfdA family dioxygenase [Kiloniellales bacterium]